MKPDKVIYSIQIMTIQQRTLECKTDYISKGNVKLVSTKNPPKLFVLQQLNYTSVDFAT